MRLVADLMPKVGLCLDDASGSPANGTKLVIEDCYGTAGEIWAEG